MLNEKELLKIIESGESQSVEFKEASDKFPISTLESISAFANTNDGIIILGVNDKDNSIIGVSNPKKIMSELYNHMNNPNSISRNVLKKDSVHTITIDNKELIIIEIEMQSFTNKPVYLKNNPKFTYIRDYEGDYLANEDILKSMYRDANSESYDSKIIDDFYINDLDEITVNSYIARFKNNNPEHPFNNYSTERFLEKINVIKTNRKTGKKCLTVAGLLVFGKHESIKEYIPHYKVEYIRKSSYSNNASYSDRLIYDGTWGDDNLYNFFFNVFEKLKATISDTSKILEDNITREGNSDLIIAIREALANSIIHADFLNPKGIKIIRYSDKMLFINSGSLRISLQDFFSGAHDTPRNHYIQAIFRHIKICENAGTGIPKIMNAVKKYHLKTPEAVAKIDSFEFTLWDTSIIEHFNITNETEKKIIEFIIKEKSTSRSTIEKELNITKNTTINYLNSLIEKNILTKFKKGRVYYYSINILEKNLEKYSIVNTLYSIIEEFKRN